VEQNQHMTRLRSKSMVKTSRPEWEWEREREREREKADKDGNNGGSDCWKETYKHGWREVLIGCLMFLLSLYFDWLMLSCAVLPQYWRSYTSRSFQNPSLTLGGGGNELRASSYALIIGFPNFQFPFLFLCFLQYVCFSFYIYFFKCYKISSY